SVVRERTNGGHGSVVAGGCDPGPTGGADPGYNSQSALLAFPLHVCMYSLADEGFVVVEPLAPARAGGELVADDRRDDALDEVQVEPRVVLGRRPGVRDLLVVHLAEQFGDPLHAAFGVSLTEGGDVSAGEFGVVLRRELDGTRAQEFVAGLDENRLGP